MSSTGPGGGRRLGGERLKVLVIGGAIVALGLVAVLAPKHGGSADADRPPSPRPSATASDDDVRPAPSANAPLGGGDSKKPSAAPTTKAPSAKVDLSTPERASEGFARAYLTRYPEREKNWGPSVDRASPWMTDELIQNLGTHEDPEWDRLIANGADRSTVTSVSVAGEGDKQPPDNPLRVYRAVTVVLHVTGREAYDDRRVLHAELSLVGDSWRVSALLGLYEPGGGSVAKG